MLFLECCYTIEVEDRGTNETVSKLYQDVLGRFTLNKTNFNGKAVYISNENPEIKLHFHSTWMHGSFWAVFKKLSIPIIIL